MKKSVIKWSQFNLLKADGQRIDDETLNGKVVLVVNVASRCGFTPQYEGLQDLFAEFKDRGLMILAFPCNQFGAQEPGTEAEIESFCSTQYGVQFPVLQKTDVNGANSHPLWSTLKEAAPGLLGIELIKWNFTKFLIDRQGNVVERFAHAATPKEMRSKIENLL